MHAACVWHVQARVASAFAFEQEKLGTNELRILLANDLFRMIVDERDAEAAKKGTMPPPPPPGAPGAAPA